MLSDYKSTILIFGMPRSGTTWIGKMFDSHPGTHYLHEPDSFRMMDGVPLVVDADDYANCAGRFSDAVAAMLRIRSIRVVGKLPVFPKEARGAFGNFSYKYVLMGIKALGRAGIDVPVPRCSGEGPQYVTPVWKSIESLGRLGCALHVMARARGLHIVRHPCGYVGSVVRGAREKRFGSEVPASEDYGLFQLLLETPTASRHELTLTALRRMSDVERLAWRWLIFNESAFNACRAHDNYRLVNYETVCADPVSEFRALFAFAGLSWSDQTERFLSHSVSANDSTYYSVVRNPLDAANAWKRELSTEEKRQVKRIVAKSAVPAFLEYDFA